MTTKELVFQVLADLPDDATMIVMRSPITSVSHDPMVGEAASTGGIETCSL